jgi:hypothetical protein
MGGSKRRTPLILNLALDENQWLVKHSDRCVFSKEPRYILSRMPGDRQIRSGCSGENIFSLYRDATPGPSSP